jgi:hypothetical protein
MKGKIIWFLSVGIFLIFNFSCSDAEDEPAEQFVYQSLVSEKDSIIAGEQTKIIATVTGGNPEYIWTADAGLLNSTDKPYQVLFSAGECELGIRKITCKVTSGSHSETKEVHIVVYD